MSTTTKPFHRIQLGSITATVWQNTDKEGRAYYGVTLEKRYRDAKGDWWSTPSFHRDDLLVIARASEKAFDLIADAQRDDRARARSHARPGQGAGNAR
ncbi:MAG: hypothetical protein AAF356_03150 [Planctomycetota bacterium]